MDERLLAHQNSPDFDVQSMEMAQPNGIRPKRSDFNKLGHFLDETRALTTKNALLLKRHWGWSVVVFGAPLLCFLIVLFIQLMITTFKSSGTTSPVIPLSLPKCENLATDIFGRKSPFYTPTCQTVLFAPNTAIEESIMKNFATFAGLEYGRDVVGRPASGFFSYWGRSAGLSDIVIYLDVSTSNKNATYYVWSNSSFGNDGALHDVFNNNGRMLSAQMFLERAITFTFDGKVASADDSPSVTIEGLPPRVSAGQIEKSGVDDHEDVTDGLKLFFVLGATLISTIVLNMIVHERKERIVGLMRLSGMTEVAYWLSWALTFVVTSLLAALLVCIVAATIQWPVFERTAFMVFMVTFFLFFTCMSALGLFLGASVSSVNMVSSILFIFVLVTATTIPEPMAYKESTNGAVQFILFWFPWFHFGKIMQDIINVTGLHVVLQNGALAVVTYNYDWSTLYDQQHYNCDIVYVNGRFVVDGSCYTARSSNYALGMLSLLSLVYYILAWYCGQVRSDGVGTPQPWFFFMSPTYWGFTKAKQSFVEGDTIAKERVLSMQNESIRIHKLSKSFKEVTAVKELSLSMKRGEITVLLGHNGSGKTTTVNMLAGLMAPTFGEAFVFGHSIRTQQKEIHQLAGLCAQDNIFWPTLTVTEHLVLFMMLKNLNCSQSVVEETLDEFGLAEMANKQVKNLSGGMKRSVSIALATLGNPSLIFLDEPTTGVDPFHKIVKWKAIQKLKRNAVVILTTHNLEEADFLADRVAMIQAGRLRALGSPLFLKNRYGFGYHVQVFCPATGAPMLRTAVQGIIPSAKVIANNSGNIRIGVPRDAVKALPKLFRWLQQCKVNQPTGGFNGVEVFEWSFSNSTLEEVFLRVCSAEITVNALDITDERVQTALCALCGERPSQRVSLFTGDGVPVMVSNVVCSMCATGKAGAAKPERTKSEWAHFLVDSETKSEESEEIVLERPSEQPAMSKCVVEVREDEVAGPREITKHNEATMSVGMEPPKLLQLQYAVAMKNFRLMFARRKALYCRVIFLVISLLIIMLPSLFIKSECPYTEDEYHPCDREALGTVLEASLFTEHGGRHALNPFTSNPFYFDQLGQIWYQEDAGVTPLPTLTAGLAGFNSSSLVKKTDVFSSVDDAIAYVVANSTFPPSYCADRWGYWISTSSSMEPAEKEVNELFPKYGVVLKSADVSTQRLDFKMLRYKPNENELVTGVLFNDTSCSRLSFQDTEYDDAVDMVHGMGAALADQNGVTLQGYVIQFPALDWKDAFTHIRDSTLQYTLLLSMLFWPDVIGRLLRERESGLVHVMRLNSLSYNMYFLTNFVFDVSLNFVWDLLVTALAYLVGNKLFVDTSAGIFILFWFLASFSMVSLGMLLAGVFKYISSICAQLSLCLNRKESTATLLAWVIVVLSFIVVPGLDQIEAENWPPYLFILPLIAQMRALMQMCRYGVTSIPADSDVGLCFLFMFVFGIVILFLAILLNSLRFGKTISWRAWFTRRSPFSLVSTDEEKAPPLSADAMAEAQRVNNSNGDEISIRVLGTHKLFDNGTHAVRDVSLGVDRGTCFGLLGPNGAGKTTLINLITGLHRPTEGDVLVGGFRVSDQLQSVYTRLGLCSQFDVVWDALTVKQHLTFFARVKGVSRANENAAVQSIAEMVDLDGDAFHMLASHLSGGQRRRLTIAISLIGNPSVWVLDEPTTGVSVDIRQKIWQIIERQRQMGRTILVTSHSLEEIDTLCDRLAIMCAGRIECIGNQNELKARFGQGFFIHFNLKREPNKSEVEHITRFVQRMSPNARLDSSLGSSLRFLIPMSANHTDELVKILMVMDTNRHELEEAFMIMEWGIANTSLQEVFVKVVKESE